MASNSNILVVSFRNVFKASIVIPSDLSPTSTDVIVRPDSTGFFLVDVDSDLKLVSVKKSKKKLYYTLAKFKVHEGIDKLEIPSQWKEKSAEEMRDLHMFYELYAEIESVKHALKRKSSRSSTVKHTTDSEVLSMGYLESVEESNSGYSSIRRGRGFGFGVGVGLPLGFVGGMALGGALAPAYYGPYAAPHHTTTIIERPVYIRGSRRDDEDEHY